MKHHYQLPINLLTLREFSTFYFNIFFIIKVSQICIKERDGQAAYASTATT